MDNHIKYMLGSILYSLSEHEENKSISGRKSVLRMITGSTFKVYIINATVVLFALYSFVTQILKRILLSHLGHV